MRYKIYGKDGSTIKCETEKLEYNGQFMADNSITASVKSNAHINFEIGDYISYRGENFTLDNIPTEKKVDHKNSNGSSFQYDNMKFVSCISELSNADFNDFVGDTQTDISFTAQPNFSFVAATIDDLLQRVQVNMDRYYTGDKKWTIKSAEGYTTDSDHQNLLITVSNISCWDALALVNSKYGINFIVRGRTVTAGTSGSVKDITFKVGLQKGLYDLTRNSQTDQKVVTRLKSYGNTTNINPRYYSLVGAMVSGRVNYATLYMPTRSDSTRLFLVFDLVHTTELNDTISIKITSGTKTYDSLKFIWDSYGDGYGYGIDTNISGYTSISSDIYSGFSVDGSGVPTKNYSVTILSGARKDNISDLSHLSFDVNSKLPNNMNIANLMLPGFPTQTLADWVEANKKTYTWLQDYINAGYTFSTEKYYPYVNSKNISSLGVRPHTEYFTSEDETHKDIYPSLQYFSDDINQVVGATKLDGTEISDNGIFADGETVSNIYIIINDLGFDFNDVIVNGTSPKIHFNSGYCGGRDFTVSSWTKDGYTWKLECARIKDESIGKYFPYVDAQIKKGDKFLITDIYMPDTYIEQASVTLLKWSLKWLAKNDYSVFSYQLTPDINFIKRHDDAITDKTTTFHQTVREGDILLIEDTDMGVTGSITIDNIKITEGDGLLPKYEITLRDTKTVGTIQKVQQQIDALTGGGSSSGYNSSQIGEIAYASLKDKFLSKEHDDKTIYNLGIGNNLKVGGTQTTEGITYAKGGVKVGTFQSGLLGSGALIDEKGNAEVESLSSRTFMSAKSFVYNLVECNIGERWSTNGFCKVKSVDPITRQITEELDEDAYSTMQVGDICRGTFSDIDSNYTTSDSDADECGFPTKKGFFTSYFYVAKIVSSAKGSCVFQYGLRNSSTPSPCSLMTCAQYGNLTDEKRRASIYQCNYPHAFTENLEGVSTFEIKSANKVKVDGWLGDTEIKLKDGGTKILPDCYGLYVQDNVYFGNSIIQLSPETLDDIQKGLNNYIVDLNCNADVINVDASGNVIGGLWEEGQNADKTETYKKYLIHSAIYVKNNNEILLIADDGADAGDGTYKVYLQCDGCTAELHNSTIYLTGITGVHDGVISTTEDESDAWYAAMRKIDHIAVTAVVTCEGKGVITKTLNIPIKHTEQSVVSADLDNEVANLVWLTTTNKYLGLPATTNLSMCHGSEAIDITGFSVQSISGITSSVVTNADKSKTFTFTQNTTTDTLSANTKIQIVATAKVNGISYERTVYFSLNKRVDSVVYELQPSSSVIHVKNVNGVLTYQTKELTCGVIAKTAEGGNSTLNALPAGYSMQVSVDGSYKDYTIGSKLDVSAAKKSVKFTLYCGGLVYDTEEIPVMSDGSDAPVYWCSPNTLLIDAVKSAGGGFNVTEDFTMTVNFCAKIGGVPLIAGTPTDVSGSPVEADLNDVSRGSGSVVFFGNGTFSEGIITVTVPFTDASGNTYIHGFPISVKAVISGKDGTDGKDGTSVTIKGTVPSISDLPTTGNTVGDGYIVGGDLYVWNGTSWIDAGKIQGPQGNTGSAAPFIALTINGTSQDTITLSTDDSGDVVGVSASSPITLGYTVANGGSYTTSMAATNCTLSGSSIIGIATQTFSYTDADGNTQTSTISVQEAQVVLTVTLSSGVKINATWHVRVDAAKYVGSFSTTTRSLLSSFTSWKTTASGQIEENTSKIAQNAESISLKVNRLNAGGRNYVLKSLAKDATINADGGTYAVVDDATMGKCLEYKLASGVNFILLFNLSADAAALKSKEVTFVVIAKPVTDEDYPTQFWTFGGWENTYNKLTNSGTSIDLADGWKKYYVTFTTDANGLVTTTGNDFGLAGIQGHWLFYAVGVFEGNAIPSWSPAPEDVKNALLATGIDIDAVSITGTADKFVLKNKAGDTVMYWDNSTNVWKFTGEVNATSGTFKNGTFTNCTVNGTLNGVSGTFYELYALNNDGKKSATIKFGDSGLSFPDSDVYMASSYKFYGTNIFCRNMFGAACRTSVVVSGSSAVAYADGLSEITNKVNFTLSAKTNTSGGTYYVIPCFNPGYKIGYNYGTDNPTAGMPVDTIIINNSSSYTYVLDLLTSQRVTVINSNDNRSLYLYINGKSFEVAGGAAVIVQNIGANMNPAPATGIIGAYQTVCSYYDNNY